MKCRTCGSAQSWAEAVLDALGESSSRSNSVIHGNCVEALVPLIEAYSPKGGLVLDPFSGSGSTGEAAFLTGRNYCPIELDAAPVAVARKRLDRSVTPIFW